MSQLNPERKKFKFSHIAGLIWPTNSVVYTYLTILSYLSHEKKDGKGKNL